MRRFRCPMAAQPQGVAEAVEVQALDAQPSRCLCGAISVPPSRGAAEAESTVERLEVQRPAELELPYHPDAGR